MISLQTPLTEALKVELPIIGGAMYPCSNAELVAAVSEAGGIGVVQPLSLVYVWGHRDLREGLRFIRKLTQKPIGMNALLEKSSKLYENRMREWIEIALEEGVRFFVTSLGNPSEVVRKVHAMGGLVYHDVTERKWALKAVDAGVDGLICVNNRAGGHAGTQSPEALVRELSDFGKPLICAGGIGDGSHFVSALKLGYAGVQLGTRLIATTECKSPGEYKQAIVEADENDIVHTERVTGIPLAVIQTPYVREIGTHAGPLTRYLLRHRRTKHWMRTFYNLNSLWRMKRSMHHGFSTKDYWQAGMSVAGVDQIESVASVLKGFAAAANR